MTSKFSQVKKISSQELANEWDSLAFERHRQISTGLDITFNNVMVPLVGSLIGDHVNDNLVDIGSGTGELTLQFAARFRRVLCIEPSAQSLEIAKSLLSKFSNISFIHSDFESFDEGSLNEFENKIIFLAAMMLSSDPQLEKFAKKLSKLAKAGDEFIATVPHPCFWPRYRGYEKESWFSYGNEILINSPFKISLSGSEFKTTHIHRPLEKYITIFSEYGFRLLNLSEPMPDKRVQSLYPNEWEFPRFIAFKWVKI